MHLECCMLTYLSVYLCLANNYLIIHQFKGLLYTLEPLRFYFYLKSKTGRWVVNPTKYWVTRKSRYGGHIRSTQTTATDPTPEPEMVQEDKCNYIYAAIMETSQIYTELTCRFPTTSLSGNKYILILYDYDRNSVLSVPMKNRGDKEIVRGFDLLIQSLIIRGLRPSLRRLENEA
jgi:hypothetical protein